MIAGIRTKTVYGITRNPEKLPQIWSEDRGMILDRAKDFTVESGSVYVLRAVTEYYVEEIIDGHHLRQ